MYLKVVEFSLEKAFTFLVSNRLMSIIYFSFFFLSLNCHSVPVSVNCLIVFLRHFSQRFTTFTIVTLNLFIGAVILGKKNIQLNIENTFTS